MSAHKPELEDYRWLTGAEGTLWLERLAASPDPLPRQIKMLRRSLSPARSHLVLEQLALRRRARKKFTGAERLFFTEKGLQQSSDEQIAHYKAQRFPAGLPVADLCCGIGGDLLALAERGPVLGVERDPATSLLAAANLGVIAAALRWGDAAEVVCRAVEEMSLAGYGGWHIDPDRRAEGRRVSHPSALEPPVEWIESLLETGEYAAVKLAPATVAPAAWRETAELEWIGSRGECRQQVAWFGRAARYAGRRVAAVLPAGGGEPRLVIEQTPGERWTEYQTEGQAQEQTARTAPARPVEQGPEVKSAARRPGRYVMEPHNAVVAAGLVTTLAAQLQLAPLAAGVAYLTADEPRWDRALDVFEVLEIWPFRLRPLRAALRQRGIGVLEIKKRGLPLDPATLRKQLKLRGENAASLLIVPLPQGTVAILARRLAPPETETGDR